MPACLAFFLVLLICNSESLNTTSEDKKYLGLFLKEWHISQTPSEVHKSFDSEIDFISTLQDSIVSQIRHQEIAHGYFGNISYYYQNRKGFCYDRAALMEKFLALYNFPSRHVYIYFGKGDKKPTLTDFFEKGLDSHAGVEVKTKKGWMAVGTNANWLGISANNEVLTFGGLRTKIQQNTLYLKKQITEGEAFWDGKRSNYKVLYGVYSRHGDFFSTPTPIKTASFIPTRHFLPDYNLKMLLYNL